MVQMWWEGIQLNGWECPIFDYLWAIHWWWACGHRVCLAQVNSGPKWSNWSKLFRCGTMRIIWSSHLWKAHQSDDMDCCSLRTDPGPSRPGHSKESGLDQMYRAKWASPIQRMTCIGPTASIGICGWDLHLFIPKFIRGSHLETV